MALALAGSHAAVALPRQVTGFAGLYEDLTLIAT